MSYACTLYDRLKQTLVCVFSGEDNVMGVELCLRNRDHVVIVMQYFPHEKFQVRLGLQSSSYVQFYKR